jgi:RNA polymerase sigma-70 factor (ECF subfamily)|tara:strand:+ start:57 stop:710 length:654 start_codon:yes stop_codon:yes gene_type:complete
MLQSATMKADPPLLETRSSLINRLKATINGKSWEDFFQTYWELIFNVARRAGLSEADAQDIVQETIVKVHKSLDRFQYNRNRGSFKGWLCSVTRSRLAEYFKKKQKRLPLNQPFDDLIGDPAAEVADPKGLELERIWDEEWQKNIIQTALKRLKQTVSPKQFQIYKCHCIDEWSVKEVCKALNVNRAQVYMAKQRVGKLFKAELTRAHEREESPHRA